MLGREEGEHKIQEVILQGQSEGGHEISWLYAGTAAVMGGGFANRGPSNWA